MPPNTRWSSVERPPWWRPAAFSRRLPHIGDGARDKNLANSGCAAGVSFYEQRGWTHCGRCDRAIGTFEGQQCARLQSSDPRTWVAAVQRKGPVTSAGFLAAQFHESGSRSAAVRMGRRSTRCRRSASENAVIASGHGCRVAPHHLNGLFAASDADVGPASSSGWNAGPAAACIPTSPVLLLCRSAT